MHASKDLQEKVRRAPVKASLVFREIVSYIKGSSQALDCAGGRLSRAQYGAIGKKMAPAFEKMDEGTSGGGGGGGGGSSSSGSSAGVGRDLVYDLYLKYEAWKESIGAYDVMDACFAIYTALRAEGYRGPRLDEIYVDEVQDFTQAEIRLFLEVCVDKNALFFTGDTCQTIARGVGFRFEDLTTMFFQLGEQQRKELSARGLRPDDMPKRALVQVPRVNQLSVNYRTHNGILGAASQIVSLLLELFPHSVDALEKDHSQIEFGAHQVVLVRDQAAKERLPAELQSALTLTIFEAKGLEFDDVFLFNFFADSPADDRTWRVITSSWARSRDESPTDTAAARERERASGRERCSERASAADVADEAEGAELSIQAPRPESFDRQRHSLLNEELKMLYTAMTRARVKVVIYDQHEEKRRPLFHYLLVKASAADGH
ncbi:lupus brain antigen 1-like protein [Chrysochromulina tobinii]|uniref:Lupus brain antigen 1-like protein n=1 Tax=Chrysochromulina tobinii TaxID=1460289 RepID=A0A0M0J8T6_9EUKA|nr:lupus brain antigen 1-like protein [Chrysochromulina tobinii]|eukprot:KOO22984.1 lupus brain antigen 1-like protein [Chrysochromulina sp. CCMP291]